MIICYHWLYVNVNYRSRTEIVAMILETANGGATKTKIMYNAYLTYNQLKNYLSLLIENNLIDYFEGTKIFKTTEKGLNLLKIHNEMAELLHTTATNELLIDEYKWLILISIQIDS